MGFLGVARSVSTVSEIYLLTRSEYVLALALFVAVLYLWISWPRRARVPVLSHHKGWTAPWKDAVRYLKDSPGVLKEGYQKV